MKLTVLVDNNTITDRYFLAEPGFSAFIEDGSTRVLFDLGYSGIFGTNADKMGIPVLKADYIADTFVPAYLCCLLTDIADA